MVNDVDYELDYYVLMELSDVSVLRFGYLISLPLHSTEYRIEYKGNFYLSELVNSAVWSDSVEKLYRLFDFCVNKYRKYDGIEMYVVPVRIGLKERANFIPELYWPYGYNNSCEIDCYELDYSLASPLPNF